MEAIPLPPRVCHQKSSPSLRAHDPLESDSARVTFGGRDTVHEELRERKSVALAEEAAQGHGRGIHFASELLNTRQGQTSLDWGNRAEVNQFRVVDRMVTDALESEMAIRGRWPFATHHSDRTHSNPPYCHHAAQTKC